MSVSAATAAVKPYAEWCQCAIFVVNHLGLEIIPGDYYTAGSFVAPDAAGKTWMEYQGFSRRPVDEIPRTGDVMVIRPNGRVYFPETPESSRLQTVNVDAWAGHIGVVQAAEAVEMDGRAYWRLSFLSSNWGVNASPMFVRSNCFNVDRSEVMAERGDADISFWRQTDVPLQRRHILNIARQLAFGYYHVGVDGKIDGYPTSGAGMIAYAWNAVWPAGQDFAAVLTAQAQPIPLASLREGDALALEDGGQAFYGLFAGLQVDESGNEDWYDQGTAYIFDSSSGALQGPKKVSEWLTPVQRQAVKAYRSRAVSAWPQVGEIDTATGADRRVTVAYTVRNEGGETLRVDSAGLWVGTPQGKKLELAGDPTVQRIEIPAGQEFVFTAELQVRSSGVFLVQPVVTVEGVETTFPDKGTAIYLSSTL